MSTICQRCHRLSKYCECKVLFVSHIEQPEPPDIPLRLDKIQEHNCSQPPAGDAQMVEEEVCKILGRAETNGDSFAVTAGRLINYIRNRLAKPVEQTDEQKVEKMLFKFGHKVLSDNGRKELAAEIASALKAGKQ